MVTAGAVLGEQWQQHERQVPRRPREFDWRKERLAGWGAGRPLRQEAFQCLVAGKERGGAGAGTVGAVRAVGQRSLSVGGRAQPSGSTAAWPGSAAGRDHRFRAGSPAAGLCEWLRTRLCPHSGRHPRPVPHTGRRTGCPLPAVLSCPLPASPPPVRQAPAPLSPGGVQGHPGAGTVQERGRKAASTQPQDCSFVLYNFY